MTDTVITAYGEEDATWYADAAHDLRRSLKEQSFHEALRSAVQSVQFWEVQHFLTGLQIRNKLRALGHGEDDHPISNLDDHYVPVMLMAVGIDIDPELCWPNVSAQEMVSTIKERVRGN